MIATKYNQIQQKNPHGQSKATVIILPKDLRKQLTIQQRAFEQSRKLNTVHNTLLRNFV
jgi:hypothetical protein